MEKMVEHFLRSLRVNADSTNQSVDQVIVHFLNILVIDVEITATVSHCKGQTFIRFVINRVFSIVANIYLVQYAIIGL